MISTRTLNTIQDYSLSVLDYRTIERLFQDNGIGRSIIYPANTKAKLYDAHMVTLNICREETKLSFVAEAIEKIYHASQVIFHPQVDVANSRRANLVNLIRKDGYELVEGKLVSIDTPTDTFAIENPETNFLQLYTELKSNKTLPTDILIGKSKDMLEALFKTICNQRNLSYEYDIKFGPLQKLALDDLKLITSDCTEHELCESYLRQIIPTVVVKINAIRHFHGYGHGKGDDYKSIDKNTAMFISNMAISIATFLIPKIDGIKLKYDRT